ETAFDDHRLVAVAVWPVTDDESRKRPPERSLGPGEGVDEEIRPLEVPQHTDIEEVGSTRCCRGRLEFAVPDTVQDHLSPDSRLADFRLVDPPFVVADEDEGVRESLLEALQPQDRAP